MSILVFETIRSLKIQEVVPFKVGIIISIIPGIMNHMGFRVLVLKALLIELTYMFRGSIILCPMVLHPASVTS